MESRRFTNTELPVFSGGEGWYQHIHVVQAIVKSNGWPDETAALQLFTHLKGEALDVALLLKKKDRDTWTGLVEGLAAYYQSPGRLAGMRRRFQTALRQPGLDPSTFATHLGMLAIQGFGDMGEQARDIMIRDKFIAGQNDCALRRQLDSFAQDTPIGEIVDSCRVWESQSDSDRLEGECVELEDDNQPSDSRTWERNRVSVVVAERHSGRKAQNKDLETHGTGEYGQKGPDWLEPLTEIIRWRLGNEKGFERGGSASRTLFNTAGPGPGGGEYLTPCLGPTEGG